MRERIKQKPIVAVLLPILFLLVALISVYQWNPLKADDQNAHLVDVKVNGKEIDKNFSVTEQGTLLEMSAEEPQVLKFFESEKYKVELLNEKGEPLPSEEVSKEKLKHYQDLVASNQKSTEQTSQPATSSSDSSTETSASKEVEEIVSQIVYVVEDEKKIPYLLLDKEDTIWLSVVNKKPEESVTVVLEETNTNKKQSLITFKQKKAEATETSKTEKTSTSSENKASSGDGEKQESATVKSSSENQTEKKANDSSKEKETSSTSAEKETSRKSAPKTKATKLTKEEKKRNLAIEQLLDEKYEEKDSFKPIELPAETASSRETRSGASPISVTGAKMTIKDGTEFFDVGNDNPGYDSGDNNQLVRSFDSILYLLTFSIEASDPTTTYSDIKYSVDMELPNGYDLDASGKQRFNGEVVSDDSSFSGEATDTTRASIGSVESTISANGQILLPMFVNVYGAQHGTSIKPTMKITIISAKNDKTSETETINKTYDELMDPTETYDALKPRETKVSAKASITATLSKGGVKPLSDVVDGGGSSLSAFGVGVTFGLKPVSGRASSDFRGSTFPNGEIKAGFHSKSYYKSNGAAAGNGDAISTYGLRAIASSVATTESTGWDKIVYSGQNFNISDAILPLFVPNGKTGEIHFSEPTVSAEDKKKIGVYDTGNIGVTNPGATISLSNTDYEPIYNPYTYRLTGMQVGTNEKVFSSSMMIVEWNREYLINKGTGVLTTDLNLTSLRYEGQTYDELQTVSVSDGTLPSGAYVSAPVWVKNTAGSHPYTNLGSYGDWSDSAGDATVGQGESNVLFGGVSAATDGDWIISIFRWNANSFEYDTDREVWGQYERYGNFLRDELRYGVGKTNDYPTPGPSSSSTSIATKSALEGQYTWYRTPEDAIANGKISAVKIVNQKPRGQILLTWNGVPLKVIGITGDKDQFGNSTAGFLNTYWSDTKENVIGQYPFANTPFTASTFDAQGNKLTTQSGRQVDSIFIKPFKIETTTTPKKPIYKTTEDVEWTVKGNILTTSDTEYGVRLTTTLPKGLAYESGTSTDASGNPLPDPTLVDKGGGITELIWNFSDVNPSQGSTVAVNFVSKPILKDLTFNDASLSEVTTRTVGDIWLQSDPSKKDTSSESLRASSGKVQLYQMQQIVLTKELDKSLIEVGNRDVALSSSDQETLTDITYKITLTNNSSDKLLDVDIVDVLPSDRSLLPSSFDGSYTVKGIKVVEGSGDITYTRDPVQEAWENDPSQIYGWGLYVPGTSNVESIKNAKGFLVSTNELAVGDSLAFEVTISPTGQKAGDIYLNRATFNSKIDLPVKSNIVQTQVLGRDLTGYVWYDDDYDGLIDTGEEPVGDIPVKLYRTSLVDGTYVKELVKESLTGQQFIDGSGDSLIKTVATGSDKGKYKFENLPEGDYLAEFMVDDIVNVQKIAIVTKQLEGTDPTLNSKADPDDFKTPEYNHAVLGDLPTLLTGTDKISHITDVNAGLTRMSKIRLLKYEEGTVIDADGDGKLSDAEIEASTTNALAGAEFQLYKGKKDDPNTIKDENKVGTVQVTDGTGWLEFASLPPGHYTIVETKAPDGFELLKNPIEVEVPTYNYIAIVHVPDSAQTKLPFTGGTKAMRIILIVSACLLVIGMAGVFLHFRPIKVRGGK